MGPTDREWAERLFANVAWGLGAVHLGLSILYFDANVALMIAVNLGCLLASSVSIRLVRKGRFRAYTLTLYCAELIALIVSAVCVGHSTGLQLPLVGLAAFAFFIEYLSRSVGIPFVPAMPLGAAAFAVYVPMFLFRFHQPGLIAVPERTVVLVELLWSALVFASVVFGMYTVIHMDSVSKNVLSGKAQTDRLTGIYNRAGYDRICAESDLKTTTLLIIDTDKFKGINDRYGHETGDRVLKNIALELERNFRSADSVCRIGGDEFAILMSGTDTLEEELIRTRIDRINRALFLLVDDRLPHVSVSVGVAHGSDAADWTALYKLADSVLYQVKKDGGRGCRFYRSPQAKQPD